MSLRSTDPVAQLKHRIAGLFSPDPAPLCDADAPYDELVEGFRERLNRAPACSPLSAEELARRWVLLRDGCDIWSGT